MSVGLAGMGRNGVKVIIGLIGHSAVLQSWNQGINMLIIKYITGSISIVHELLRLVSIHRFFPLYVVAVGEISRESLGKVPCLWLGMLLC